MSTFVEELHPRAQDGTFTEKGLSPAEVTLAPASTDVTSGELAEPGARLSPGQRRAAELSVGHEIRLAELVEGIADENTRLWWELRLAREPVGHLADISTEDGVTELTLTGSQGVGTLTVPEGLVVEIDLSAACQACEEPLPWDDEDGLCDSCSGAEFAAEM